MNSIAEKEKQNAATSSVIAAVFLTSFKIIVGLLTGSLGILSEAAHSGLDLVAALVTFFAVRFSDRPPDEGHLYGHGKIENLSALIETLLLLLTCAWIVYEAIERLFFKSVEVHANAWAFAVMGTSIVVDISRSRVLYAAARKHNSQALEADALHFSTDVWSSLTVILGLAVVRLGDYLGAGWEWLGKADAVAALGVALIVVYVSVQLGQRAIAVLLDAAPPGLVERIGSEAAQLPGVQSVGPVRVRQGGALTFVDLSVGVDRGASLEQAHRVAEMVESRIVALIPRGDVVVHVDPEQRSGESLPQAVNAIAGRLGLQTHNIHAREVRGDYYVALHVEAPASMTLAQAHEQVSRLEATLCDELPYVKEVNSHIEPQSIGVAPDATPETNTQERLRAQVVALIERTPELRGCHNVRVWPGSEGYEVVLHCLADPDLPIEEAHRLAHQVEEQLRAHVPGVSRVLVHVEPEGEL
jgi:cation diffusion facilitator family transporter